MHCRAWVIVANSYKNYHATSIRYIRKLDPKKNDPKKKDPKRNVYCTVSYRIHTYYKLHTFIAIIQFYVFKLYSVLDIISLIDCVYVYILLYDINIHKRIKYTGVFCMSVGSYIG